MTAKTNQWVANKVEPLSKQKMMTKSVWLKALEEPTNKRSYSNRSKQMKLVIRISRKAVKTLQSRTTKWNTNMLSKTLLSKINQCLLKTTQKPKRKTNGHPTNSTKKVKALPLTMKSKCKTQLNFLMATKSQIRPRLPVYQIWQR